MIRLALSGLLLMAGGSVYLLFRPRSLLLFSVVDSLGLGGLVDSLRESVGQSRPPLLVVYSVPDALWVSSYILVADWLTGGMEAWRRALCASVVPAVGLVSEAAQAVGLCPGTFDVWDVVAYGAPYIVYEIFNEKRRWLSSPVSS